MLAQNASLKRQTLCVIREHRKELAEPSGSEQPGLKSTGQESEVEVVKLKVIEACKNLESFLILLLLLFFASISPNLSAKRKAQIR